VNVLAVTHSSRPTTKPATMDKPVMMIEDMTMITMVADRMKRP
jgi:hypothetical protein